MGTATKDSRVMQKRFATIWFCYVKTDWFARRQPLLKNSAFVLAAPTHGRLLVTDRNIRATLLGVDIGMAVADAKAIFPLLQVLDDQPGLAGKLLKNMAEWCIRYTPVIGIDPPDGLLLDITGCTHLWGGEAQYIAGIHKRFTDFSYTVRIAVADTIGTAWAIARYGKEPLIVESGAQTDSLLSLPPQALRIEAGMVEQLGKLGLRRVGDFIGLPRKALRRRFGPQFLQRIDQALGLEEEWITPVHPIEPYQERLPCLELIVTSTGIEIALQRLLNALCSRLQQAQKGLRMANLTCYRADGKIEKITIGTNRPTCAINHLFTLFEIKINSIEPALGIELFTLDALQVEDLCNRQENLWDDAKGLDDIGLSELLDRIDGKVGGGKIHRYMPAEHYWPERSYQPAVSINEKLQDSWKIDRPRPLQLLNNPEPIEVAAPIPDYPPMNFRYKGKLHTITRADGPERIEQEWWLQEGQHRDYYVVEDEEGHRYWLFRSGHYDATKSHQWFIHGFFA